MWTVIYIAPNAKTAERIEDRLAGEGFFVKVRQTNIAKQQYEILVPETELDEVQEVLKEILHSSHRYP
ncbi:glutamate decarboxylase [Tumebacillus sp. DT12]|uniref:Glutamate decarboxylase n=1 Tax=Tumebacillus lacus TaxID=2995335 RepID=A0ABT3X2J3_9BACL|nr:glutamate decarboxylase [Tumebacillus lacus]MCX7570671.1 glutamate decarboxylase [Tumebacillus lacus]